MRNYHSVDTTHECTPLFKKRERNSKWDEKNKQREKNEKSRTTQNTLHTKWMLVEQREETLVEAEWKKSKQLYLFELSKQ